MSHRIKHLLELLADATPEDVVALERHIAETRAVLDALCAVRRAVCPEADQPPEVALNGHVQLPAEPPWHLSGEAHRAAD